MKIVWKLFRFTVIFFIFGLFVFNFTPLALRFFYSTGFLKEKIMIVGTGSMYPTFPKGEGSTDILRAQETVAWPKMSACHPRGVLSRRASEPKFVSGYS